MSNTTAVTTGAGSSYLFKAHAINPGIWLCLCSSFFCFHCCLLRTVVCFFGAFRILFAIALSVCLRHMLLSDLWYLTPPFCLIPKLSITPIKLKSPALYLILILQKSFITLTNWNKLFLKNAISRHSQQNVDSVWVFERWYIKIF